MPRRGNPWVTHPVGAPCNSRKRRSFLQEASGKIEASAGGLPSLTSLYQRIVRLTAEQHVAGEDAEIPAGHLATSAGIARKTSAGAARSTERDFLWALDQAPNQSKTANRATQITAANPKLDIGCYPHIRRPDRPQADPAFTASNAAFPPRARIAAKRSQFFTTTKMPAPEPPRSPNRRGPAPRRAAAKGPNKKISPRKPKNPASQ